MTVNIYDSANQIERELRETPEYLNLKEAFEKVKGDQETYTLFQQFQNLQMELQQKQMEGHDFTDEDAKRAQEVAEKVQGNSLIESLMLAEQTFSVIVNDLNRIIMKPVQELYDIK